MDPDSIDKTKAPPHSIHRVDDIAESARLKQARELDETNGQLRSEVALRKRSEQHFDLLVEEVRDYAIYMLDTRGHITSWNQGAQRSKGYRSEEIIGRSFDCFYTPEDRLKHKPETMLRRAAEEGRVEDEGWRVRKDGSYFWADAVLTALRDDDGNLLGFAKITRDATKRREHEEHIDQLNVHLRRQADDLLEANKELEAFSYSVSHDLRTPLRAINGFSRELVKNQTARLDDEGKKDLERICQATQRMAQIIDDLLNLSRVTRCDLARKRVDLGGLAERVLQQLRATDPGRAVEFHAAPNLTTEADANLLLIALENLVGNAWKFTKKQPHAKIEVGTATHDGSPAFFVRDNGVGFNMAYADKLFGVFQRLHTEKEFPGTGIGLALVRRVIHRHGGRIWAHAEEDRGATFYFTLGKAPVGN